MQGKITEVFKSIQGEGIYCGQPQVFVRFFGCNLNCRYCDTLTYRFKEYDSDALLSEIKSFGPDLPTVSFTGGEPLLQYDFLTEILPLVKKEGYITYLESNGTLPEALEKIIDNIDIIAMDMKLPSSSRALVDCWQEHRDFLKIAGNKDVFVKAVICSWTKEEEIVTMLHCLNKINYSSILVLQPNSYEPYELLKRKVEHFKEISELYSVPTCVIPQIHKLVGVK